MRNTSLLCLSLGALVLSGCATTPEPTFADILGTRVSEYAAVKKDWQAGAILKAEGEKEMARGQADIEKGEKLVNRGKEQLERGQAKVDKGADQVSKAEADYRDLVANPAALPTPAP